MLHKRLLGFLDLRWRYSCHLVPAATSEAIQRQWEFFLSPRRCFIVLMSRVRKVLIEVP